METKQEERLHARNLYFNTNLSQQEIADKLSINRKTLYLWMNEGGWRHAKYAAAHAPTLLLDQYYEQLGKLNQNIATRENPWPTTEEAATIRKLSLTITQFKDHGGVRQTMNVFHDFIEYLRVKENNLAMAKEYIKPMDRYLKKIAEDCRWLNYNTQYEEERHFQLEYEQWLKTQKEEQPSDVILNSSKEEPVKEQAPTPIAQPQPIPVPLPQTDNNPNPVTVSVSKDIVSAPKNPAPQLKPMTFFELARQKELERMNLRPKTEPNPNHVFPAPPKNHPVPIPHPTQPRYLTNYDLQKMMETPPTGLRPKHFNR